MKEKVLTIDRAKWYRGKGSDESLLLNDDGLMCCLGFDAIACGLDACDIINVETPASMLIQHRTIKNRHSDYFGRRVENLKELSHVAPVDAAIKHNDDDRLTEEERERLIRADLIALGWDDVVFV